MPRSYLKRIAAALLVLLLAVSALAQPRPRRPAARSTVAVPMPPSLLAEADRARAEGMYERLCAGCHGALGDGQGPLARYLTVAPRDFVHQPFKWRSTPSGSRPAVADVARTIARGVPGAAMPAFGPALRPADRDLLARYVLALGRGGAGQPPAAQPALPTSSELITRGEELYRTLQCASCHGDALRGDGPAAANQRPPPYDLTALPPRGGGDVDSLTRSLRNGLDGTPMPAFGEALPERDLAALVHFLRARIPTAVLEARAPNDAAGEAHWLTDASASGLPTPPPSGLLTDPAREARERTLWDFPLAPQGEGPPQLTPAERSLDPSQCARCHAQQFAQFRTTVHANAMGPGVLGQLVDMPPADVATCQRCHAPLAEQNPTLAGSATPNPDFDPALRAQGIVCAACHLRGRERSGPPPRVGSGRLAGSLYPLTTLSRYERGDFCAPCHQHTHAETVAGVPVLDTVSEWVNGPYFARGVQCQHCHMPDREHTWRGAHDPDAVRQAVRTTMRVRREGAELVAEVRVENIGAGHAFPGTTTPAAVLEVQWLDAAGRALGATTSETIQRRLEWTGQGFVQRFDTRVPPGGVRVLAARTRDAAVRAARYTLTFRPDDYYAGFYAREAEQAWRSARGRELLREALGRASGSAFVVRSETVAAP